MKSAKDGFNDWYKQACLEYPSLMAITNTEILAMCWASGVLFVVEQIEPKVDELESNWKAISILLK